MSTIDIVLVILVIAWLGGFSLRIGGGLIHLLLVVAAVIFIARMLGFSG